jgi:hypothetical protein
MLLGAKGGAEGKPLGLSSHSMLLGAEGSSA